MWNQPLIWLHVITDALVALSYYSIPAALFFAAKKKPDSIPVRPLVILFALFIAFCGAGHLMDIVSIWKPIYWLKGFWNIGTALTSVVTAIVLIPKVAEYVNMPDTTEKLHREKRVLEEKHGILQAVLDSVSEGILLRGESGRPLAYNSAAVALLGSRLQIDWAGHSSEDRDSERRKDGSVVERHTKYIPGVGQLYVLRNLTEEIRSQGSLLQLQHVISTMKKGFCTVALPELNIISANPAYAGMLGYAVEELAGQPLASVQTGDDAEFQKWLQTLKDRPGGDHCWEGELIGARKNGSLFPALVRVNHHQGSEGEFLSILQNDITQQKQMEAESAALQKKLLEAQKLESLGVLAGGVAHDFNNLLTGIVGNSSLALEFVTPGDAAHACISDVLTASERAADLTRQLLAYSGRGRFIVGPVNLSALAEETKTLVHLSIPRSVQLHLNLKQGLPMVEADASQLQQLLMNLVINGAEAIGEKNGSVRISTGVQTLNEQDLPDTFAEDHLAPGEYVYMEIQDNGCGIDEETKAHIFDPFFTTKFTGRGLGLAASLGIVRGHHGTMKVYSVPNAGSTFKVYLPALPGEIAVAVPEPPVPDLHGAGTILVVDDESAVRKTTFNALVHYGYEVLQAEDGRSGLELFSSMPSRFSAVLLDLTMPVMDGREALERIRAVRADVPVILTSGFSECEAVRRFGAKQLAGFLQKPFTAAQLAQKVKAAIQT